MGVHNGARDAALQAAVDLLATAPPAICSPPANASQYDLAVGMKESHAWMRLKVRPQCLPPRCSFFNRGLSVATYVLQRHTAVRGAPVAAAGRWVRGGRGCLPTMIWTVTATLTC